MDKVDQKKLAEGANKIREFPVDIDHLACFAYPNCDEDPNGCRLNNGDAETGHRDGTVKPNPNKRG